MRRDERQQRSREGSTHSGSAHNGEPSLRVLIVAPSLGILGGQAVQADRMFTRLSQEPTLEVAFLPVNPQLPGTLGKLQRIKYVRTIVTSVAYIAALLRAVPRCDIAHIFSASYSSFLIAPTPAILVTKLFSKKAVLNYRSGQAEGHLGKSRWRHTALPVIRFVDAIVAPSGYLVDVFARFGFKAYSIFNFVDTERFRFRKRVPLRPVFLSNRNHEPLYNVACVLRAFAIIQRRFTEARLTVAGDGSERWMLEDLARELNLRNVEFIGRVPNDRMPEFYDAADIYLNSPNIDNMPGSIIEAFAAGTPIVTTNAGGIPYIVSHEETAMMVERGDAKALAACAVRLLEDEELAARLVANAHAECRKYAWESVRDEWLRLYETVARGRASKVDDAAAVNAPQRIGDERKTVGG